MTRGHTDEDAGLTEWNRSDSVQQRDTSDSRPPVSRRGRDLEQSHSRHRLVGLVVDRHDTICGATRDVRRVFANHPGEEHDGPALRQCRPVDRRLDRQIVGYHGDIRIGRACFRSRIRIHFSDSVDFAHGTPLPPRVHRGLPNRVIHS